jgi:predicted nucleic acid-binding protein
MRLIREGLAIWVSSTVLNLEVNRNPQSDRRRDAEALLLFANEIAVPKVAEAERASRLEERGFSPFDALHLAIAEEAAVDVFLTTDDGILHRARRNLALLRVRVENPVSWYRELQHASHE